MDLPCSMPCSFHGHVIVMPRSDDGRAGVRLWSNHGSCHCHTLIMPPPRNEWAMVMPWCIHAQVMVMPVPCHERAMILPWCMSWFYAVNAPSCMLVQWRMPWTRHGARYGHSKVMPWSYHGHATDVSMIKPRALPWSCHGHAINTTMVMTRCSKLCMP